MQILSRTTATSIAVWVVAVSFVTASGGAPFAAGNIIVSNSPFGDPRLYEFTRGGVQIQEVDIPSSVEHRDLVLDRNGDAAVYAGTFNPVLTTYDPAVGAFSNTSGPDGWSTVNNLTYGGMAAFGKWVFATDMATSAPGSPSGIIRFDIVDYSSVRFGVGNNIDLNVGLDGLLYALDNNASAAGSHIRVYDPTSMLFQRSFTLGAPVRAIAVNAAGHVFAAQREPVSRVVHFDSNGAFVGSLADPGIGGFGDIDIAYDGDLLVASHGGVVLLTDTSLTDATFFNTRTSNGMNFAAFVQRPVPEASTMMLMAVGLLAGVVVRSRGKRSKQTG